MAAQKHEIAGSLAASPGTSMRNPTRYTEWLTNRLPTSGAGDRAMVEFTYATV